MRTWTQEHSLASHPHTHAHHVHTGAFARAHTHTLTHSLTHRTKATAREWRVGATATSCGCARRATPPSAALAVRSPRKCTDLRGCRIIFLATCGSIAPASGRAGIIRFLFRIRFICWRTCASPARCRDFFAPVAFQGFGFTLERHGEWRVSSNGECVRGQHSIWISQPGEAGAREGAGEAEVGRESCREAG